MDSKILIGYCQKLGMTIKDSPLASISEDERDRVLAFIKQGPDSGESTAKTEAGPTREPVKPVGKVPAGRTPAPKGPLAREGRRDREVAAQEPQAIHEPAPSAETRIAEPPTPEKGPGQGPAAAPRKTPAAEAPTDEQRRP